MLEYHRGGWNVLDPASKPNGMFNVKSRCVRRESAANTLKLSQMMALQVNPLPELPIHTQDVFGTTLEQRTSKLKLVSIDVL